MLESHTQYTSKCAFRLRSRHRRIEAFDTCYSTAQSTSTLIVFNWFVLGLWHMQHQIEMAETAHGATFCGIPSRLQSIDGWQIAYNLNILRQSAAQHTDEHIQKIDWQFISIKNTLSMVSYDTFDYYCYHMYRYGFAAQHIKMLITCSMSDPNIQTEWQASYGRSGSTS